MYLRAVAVALFMLYCGTASSGKQSTEHKGNTSSLQNCRSCKECSPDNGCLTCQQRLFLLIKREGIRQQGECVHACPVGHYSIRGQATNRCLRCKTVNCESCFSREFCIRCKSEHYLLKGKCYNTCPKGTASHARLMECVDGCDVGPWGEWGPCLKNQQTCGFKWGLETRTRQILTAWPKEWEPCVALSMSRKCRIKARYCPGERRKMMNKNRRNKHKKKKLAAEVQSDEDDSSS
ncbi:R-spondin-4 isoform X1 [Chiloscyllium plagiosum]|uniref:R-spondin-4 isoform X1 n=1 Tax=Chiloscyllium plagiosum TaxID=36176 RepID=UPI001CB7CF17|nr:R-spondin-4 isoform X1 [Chiloscyllium plagiosum]